ncbi:hypothetical protein [Natrinema sp. 1APR25-10V2]|uniref:hypothetical protein n=1 Tax=Natrinema sp. 1APR25-10V2 TaxID=2951081 RepID=UPI0028765DD9|nr:hypothetical protein [Natrinema sp. 1APR25-10V2]MDS0474547.1 hypothetical protein [Natrinema sp. 1APR25-10V2]
MASFTCYDIPPIILALLGALLLLYGVGLGTETVVSMLTVPNYGGWAGLVIFISLFASFFGSITTLFGVWFVYDPEFKLPTSIVSGILVLGFVRLV